MLYILYMFCNIYPTYLGINVNIYCLYMNNALFYACKLYVEITQERFFSQTEISSQIPLKKELSLYAKVYLHIYEKYI